MPVSPLLKTPADVLKCLFGSMSTQDETHDDSRTKRMMFVKVPGRA